ncbi:MAG: hypothetical protein ACI843_000567 [Psychrobacter glaciei]|jgi:uncharacterized protein (DUF2164 family)
MSEIKLDDRQKSEAVDKLKIYFDKEMHQDIGQFEAEFLLDFFSKELAPYFYNQGLQDAGLLFQEKFEDVTHNLYELEKQTY